eukprot:scaffold2776_cov239-Pinguiococcus_pyrenoidosus.AAC.1
MCVCEAREEWDGDELRHARTQPQKQAGTSLPRGFLQLAVASTLCAAQLSALSSQLSALSSQLSDQIERSLSHPTKTCSLTVTKAPSSPVMHQLIGMSVYVPN